MKTTLLVLILWMHVLVASILAYPPDRPLGEALQDWKTIRITLIIWDGERAGPEPSILLERLDASRVFLSTLQRASAELGALPVARAVITSATAAKYVERAQDFYGQAESEVSEKMRLPRAEWNAYFKAHNHGIPVRSIKMEVLGRDKSYVYEHDFADEGETVKKFQEFLEHPKIGLPL
jgi:hypothetical protein